jgi:hypothetical protein
MYYAVMKERLNLKDPQNFNQKIQWIKLYDRNPLYTKLADKYAVREYVANKIEDKYLIPLLGTWDSFDEIDFKKLPEQFVLKCNHDSGSVIICKDKNMFDKDAARKKIERCMAINFCDRLPWREWQYRDIKPKIIAEKYMVNASGEETNDYKFFCFNGEPKCLYVSAELYTTHQKVTFFDLNWNILQISAGFEKLFPVPPKPEKFEEMILISRKLADDIPFVRVDLYLIDNEIYFSELTLTPHAGYYPFNPPEWNKTFGDWLKLPEK